MIQLYTVGEILLNKRNKDKMTVFVKAEYLTGYTMKSLKEMINNGNSTT